MLLKDAFQTARKHYAPNKWIKAANKCTHAAGKQLNLNYNLKLP